MFATFRFYEELNDFLPKARQRTPARYRFKGTPSIKDAIEAQGVPHTEVDLILVNGNSVPFSYLLKEHDRVSVFPVFESIDISEVTLLRNQPLRETKFILDVHLGKLARYLRLFGFDTLYTNSYRDDEIVEIALNEKRIILTRDVGLLKIRKITHGYWVRSQCFREQLIEIFRRFDLFDSFKPFTRCLSCNGMLNRVDKKEVLHLLKPLTRQYYEVFYRCDSCKKVFWPGTHYEKMVEFVQGVSKDRPPT